MLSHISQPFPPASLLERLTPAEHAVALQLAQGQTNKQIAAALGRSAATVKAQLGAAMAKAGVDSRTRLLVLLLSEQPEVPATRR